MSLGTQCLHHGGKSLSARSIHQCFSSDAGFPSDTSIVGTSTRGAFEGADPPTPSEASQKGKVSA